MKKFTLYCLVIILILSFCIWMSGKLLDMEAERVVLQMYSRDKDGVIDGMQPVALNKVPHKKAVVFIHGFLGSPFIFSGLIEDIQHQVDSDIYVPLLAFHGKDLQTESQFNNQIIIANIEAYLNELAKQYECVMVVGFSYGGSVLTSLAINNALAANIHVVLYAPAVYVQNNTFVNRVGQNFYSLWRNYCNYSSLGCASVQDSGDNTSRLLLQNEKNLQYKVLSAMKQLNVLDLQNRINFDNIHRPYSLIVAEDDNRVFYSLQKEACDKNKRYCHLYSFSSGRHMIHYGARKKEFEDLIIQLLDACS